MKFSDKYRPGLHDFGFVLKKNGWICGVGMLVFLLLIPFSTAGLPGSSIFNVEVTHDQMKFRLFHPDVIPVLLGALVALGFAAGAALFRFLLDRHQTTIFLSMGVTRARLLCNRLLAGLLIIGLSVSIPMALSRQLNLMALGDHAGLTINTLYLTLGMTAVAMVSFLAAGICIFLSGTLAEAAVCWAGLMSLPTVVCYGLNQLLKTLFWGNAWGEIVYSGTQEVSPSLVELGAWWNPILFFHDSLQTHGIFVRPLTTDTSEAVAWPLLLGWGAVALCLTGAAWLLLGRRKAEQAGITACSPALSEGIILLTGFLAFSEVFSLLYGYAPWLGAGLGAAAFCAVHLFWRKTLFSGGASGRRSFHSLILQGCCLCFVCLYCAFGLTASAERFLETAQVEQVEVTYTGAPQFLNGVVSGSSTGRGYYITGSLTLETQEGIGKAKELQKLFLESGRREAGTGANAADTVIPYDITFSYLDPDGKRHTWYYDRCSFQQLEAMLSLEETQEVRTRQAELFSLDSTNAEGFAAAAYASSELYLTDPWLLNPYRVTLTEQQRAELLEALAEDVVRMTLEERYFPEEPVQAVLMFTNTAQQDCKYYTYHLNNEYLYLTASYSATLSWLDRNGLLALVSVEPEAEYIVLQRFDPYAGMNGLSYPMGMYFMSYCADTSSEFLIQKDFGKQYIFTDPGEVETLLSRFQNGYYMTRGGFLAAVKFAGQEKLRYFFLPQGQIPEFVRG